MGRSEAGRVKPDVRMSGEDHQPWSKKWGWGFAILVLFVWILNSGWILNSPQDSGDVRDQPPIRVEVEAVNVLATVTDRRTGAFIPDLEASDFRITENGVFQHITHFARQTDLPLTIALCIDTSASVRLKLGFQKEAAADFIFSVMRPVDRALLLEFDTGVTLLHDFTPNPNDLVREIERLRAGGGTSLYDAIYLVAEQKMLSESGRKTAIILSDGADLTSRRTLEEALRMAMKAEMTLYAISTTRFGAVVDYHGERALRQLTEASGGRTYFPHSPRQLTEAFREVEEELRNQYSLTYVPINRDRDGSFRRIKVELNRGGAVVRHREGYYADPVPNY